MKVFDIIMSKIPVIYWTIGMAFIVMGGFSDNKALSVAYSGFGLACFAYAKATENERKIEQLETDVYEEEK